MSKTKTAELQERIAKLEGDCVAKFGEIETLEAEVAEAYGAGADPADKQEKLRAVRDDHATMRKALDALDKKIIEVSAEENRAKRQELQKDSVRQYTKVVNEILGAIKKAAPTAAKHVDRRIADKLAADLEKVVRRSVWDTVNSDFSAAYLEQVPQMVKSVPRRYPSGAVDTRPEGLFTRLGA